MNKDIYILSEDRLRAWVTSSPALRMLTVALHAYGNEPGEQTAAVPVAQGC